ncbi:MAG: iron-sulfur cluster assembly scaffold protein [Anaerolineae bacterium]|jgi:nitrogen fixation NifU-like protein
MYSDVLIEHFTNPRNVGTIDDADAYARVESDACGDVMELYLRVRDGLIDDIKYRTFGCAAAIASSSMASEMIKGRPLAEAARLSDEMIVGALGGLPEAKIHCSVLAASALHAALENYFQAHPEARPAG